MNCAFFCSHSHFQHFQTHVTSIVVRSPLSPLPKCIRKWRFFLGTFIGINVIGNISLGYSMIWLLKSRFLLAKNYLVRKQKQQNCFTVEGKQDTQTSFFAAVSLTLTRWPWPTNLTCSFRWCTYVPKIKLVHEELQKLQHYTQTHRKMQPNVGWKTFRFI